MTSAKDSPPADAAPPKKGGGKKLLLLAVPLLLIGAVAGLWFGGVLPPLLGMGEAKPAEGEHAAAIPKEAPTASSKPPVFLDLPEIVANLNAGPRRTGFVKLRAKLELASTDDQPVVTAAMPRLLDLFQTYLREMRPEELRGAIGTYRLREELIARADIAVAPAHVVNVLFTEMLVQ
jgi:flagellar FliL protein